MECMRVHPALLQNLPKLGPAEPGGWAGGLGEGSGREWAPDPQLLAAGRVLSAEIHQHTCAPR